MTVGSTFIACMLTILGYSIQSQRTCFDDDIVASDNLCHLNIGIFCHAFHNRLYLFVQLFDGVILVERNVDGSTALEVKAEVQCASLCLMHENHAGRNGKQQNAGDREEDLSLFHKWKSLALFLGSVVFRILQSHTVQAVDQQSGNNHGAEHGKNNTKSKVELNLIALNAFDLTLTLPGIAGVILSIGMAVDANVIIYARIEEEIGAGKTVHAAIRDGFKKAASAILDGNVTTLIAAAVLYALASGSVRGFAMTLALGIVLSMFSAMVVSRP